MVAEKKVSFYNSQLATHQSQAKQAQGEQDHVSTQLLAKAEKCAAQRSEAVKHMRDRATQVRALRAALTKLLSSQVRNPEP